MGDSELDSFDEKDELIGTKISDDVAIKSIIGSGGMGKVYLAEQFLTGLSKPKKVAVKTLNLKSIMGYEYMERIYREIAAMSKLEHKNILNIIQAVEKNGVPFIVMEYCDISLRDYLTLQKIPSKEEDFSDLTNIFTQTLYGLSYAHKKGFIHRDITPSNIFIKENEIKVEVGEPNLERLVKLGDFSLVKINASEERELLSKKGFETTIDKTIGTPYYRSPEQTRIGEKTDQKTDLWQMGVVMYESLTGKLPFDADDYEKLYVNIRTKNPVTPRYYNNKIPKPLEVITLRLLEKNPNRRYDSADSVIRDLSAFNKGVSLFRIDPKYPYYNIKQIINKPIKQKRVIAAAVISTILLVPSMLYINGDIDNNKLAGVMITSKNEGKEILSGLNIDSSVKNNYLDENYAEKLRLSSIAKLIQKEFNEPTYYASKNAVDVDSKHEFDINSVIYSFEISGMSRIEKIEKYFNTIDELKIFPYVQNSLLENVDKNHVSMFEFQKDAKIIPKIISSNIKRCKWIGGNKYAARFGLDYLLNKTIYQNSDVAEKYLNPLIKLVVSKNESLGLKPSRIVPLIELLNEGYEFENVALIKNAIKYSVDEYLKRYHEDKIGLVSMLNKSDRIKRNFGQDVIFTSNMLAEILPIMEYSDEYDVIYSTIDKFIGNGVGVDGSVYRFTYKESDKKFIKENDTEEFVVINHVNMMNGLNVAYEILDKKYSLSNESFILNKENILLDKIKSISDYYVDKYYFYENDLNSTALAIKGLSNYALILKSRNEFNESNKYMTYAIDLMEKLLSKKYSDADINNTIFISDAYSGSDESITYLETITYCQDIINNMKKYKN